MQPAIDNDVRYMRGMCLSRTYFIERKTALQKYQIVLADLLLERTR